MTTEKQNLKAYDLTEHIFRFAAWSASTAANSSKTCRFKVDKGRQILIDSGLKKLAEGFHNLKDVEEFDAWHDKKCLELKKKAKYILKEASAQKEEKNFTYGIAAKLLNCYLKTIFVIQFTGSLSTAERKKVGAIHPPIDRLLLNGIRANLNALYDESQIATKRKFWKGEDIQSWSLYEAENYKKVISEIKQIQKYRKQPLWNIEALWRGYQ